jgi:hypothetical protein
VRIASKAGNLKYFNDVETIGSLKMEMNISLSQIGGTTCGMSLCRKPPAMRTNKPIICFVGNVVDTGRKPEAFLPSGP